MLYSQVMVPLAMHQEGVHVRIVAFAQIGQMLRSGTRRELKAIRQRAREQLGLHVTHLPSPPSRIPQLWDDTRTLKWWLGRHYDRSRPFILHCRGASAANMALEARRRFPACKVIFDCRGAESEEQVYMQGYDGVPPEDWPKDLQEEIARRDHLTRRAFQHSDHVYCVSQAMLDYLTHRYGTSEAGCTVMPCCPDVDSFQRAHSHRDEKRAALGISDRFVVAYCGSVTKYQLPDQSLRVLQLIRRIREGRLFFWR